MENDNYFVTNHKIKISWKWATKELNCCYDGIINGCEGKCCKNVSCWVPIKDGKKIGNCIYLGKDGCILTIKEKPIICLLYPLVIRKNSIILHYRGLSFCCKKCYKVGGKTIFQQNKNNLIEIFGEKTINEMEESINNQKDYEFYIDDTLFKQINYEEELIKNNSHPPKERKYY